VIRPLSVEALTTSASSQASAIAALKAQSGYATAQTGAYDDWKAKFLALIQGDHAGGSGPTYAAERAIVNPMIQSILNAVPGTH
jgi:hypothetical protein